MVARHGAEVRRETRQGKGDVVRRMFADIEADLYVLVDGDCWQPMANRCWWQAIQPDAIVELQKASAQSPSDWRVQSALGVAYGMGGDMATALVLLQEVAASLDATVQVRRNYALFLALSGDMAGAEEIVRVDLIDLVVATGTAGDMVRLDRIPGQNCQCRHSLWMIFPSGRSSVLIRTSTLGSSIISEGFCAASSVDARNWLTKYAVTPATARATTTRMMFTMRMGSFATPPAI